jgi:uncharacterized membrane protein YjgN (DUF898 family)
VLSLGWYTPIARLNRAKLMWENTGFGDQAFVFANDGQPRQEGLWLPFALGWFALPLATVVSFFHVTMASASLIGTGAIAAPTPDTPSMAFNFGVGLAVIALVLFFSLLFWAPYNAAAMNRIASLIRLDGARFRLKARTLSLFGVMLAGWIVIILSLGLLAPVAGFLRVRYVINRLEIIGTPRFAEVGQAVIGAPGSGEGLGDAFDLDMGVGVL